MTGSQNYLVRPTGSHHAPYTLSRKPPNADVFRGFSDRVEFFKADVEIYDIANFFQIEGWLHSELDLDN